MIHRNVEVLQGNSSIQIAYAKVGNLAKQAQVPFHVNAIIQLPYGGRLGGNVIELQKRN